MSEMLVEWVEEVPDKRRMGKWGRICDELRGNPNQWAKVHTGTSTAFASMLKQGKLGMSEKGEFEATCRRNAKGTYDIYARFVGVPIKTAG